MEKDRSAEIGLDQSVCDHVVRTVYGLPCAHELLQYGRTNRPIPLEAIDEHWRKLTISSNIADEEDIFRTVEMTLLKTLFDQSTEDEKNVILQKLKDLATPYMASLKEPTPIIPKGRPLKRKLSQKENKHESSTKRNPSGFEYAKTGDEENQLTIPDKSSQLSRPKKQVVKKKKTEVNRTTKWEFKAYMQYIPTLMHPFIAAIENVPGDDHCGFRCFAKQMGWHNDDQDWKMVRYDLLTDLSRYKDLYDTVWKNWFCIDNRAKIDLFLPKAEDPKHWMCMPDAGFITASAYNYVVVFLSNTGSLIFFPHAEPPVEGSEIRVICLALVYGNHFVSVTLKDNTPLPNVASMWNVLRTLEAAAWE